MGIKSEMELCERVFERLLKVNPDVDVEELFSKAKRAVKVLKTIQQLPRYSQVINMTHQELNLVIQQCPESPYFCRDDF